MCIRDRHGLRTERQVWEGPLPDPIPGTQGCWLLRLSLNPSKVHSLLQSREAQVLQGWHWQIAAGAGCGDLWCDTNTPADQVQALRERVETLGGQLNVLIQPPECQDHLLAWRDATSKSLIEAVKRQFDPQQQLNRGRLPGVAQPFGGQQL